MPPIKKIILGILAIFMVYAVVTSPNEAATIVNAIWDVIVNGAKNVMRFFDALIGGN
ncbi:MULTISPECIES: hypothetical protein [unclassified Janibacter]|uniref:hypothetical protein n=1 Tax=unclassified Janibacter TaxID=2649294 RepID=UPI003CFBFFD2